MGGEDSKPKEQDCFILEHLSKMSLKSKKTISYYFIQPHRDADLESTLKHLRQYFKLDYFPEIKTLKQEMSFVHKHQIVKVIFTKDLPLEDLEYLQQEQKISQLVLFGDAGTSHNYKKVVGEAKSVDRLIELLNQLQEKDALQIPSSNLLLLIDQDTKMLNKYRLNYHCNTRFRGREKAKSDFIELARKIYPQQEDSIGEFEKNYDLSLEGEARQKMVLEWLIKDNFYWQLVHTLTRTTSDPKRLAYIRLGLKDIYETIFTLFKKQLYFKEMYVVVDITEQEKVKLQKSTNNFLLFTSFVRGYLDKKAAKDYLKTRGANAIMFDVIPYRKQTLQSSLDFGYVVFPQQKSVIFNIYNVFRIGQISIKGKSGQLQYGALPQIFQKRKDEDVRTHKMTKLQLDLMRNYDYLEDMLNKVDSQATLLQLAGYYDQALQVYDQRVNFIRESVHDSEETMNRCLIRKGDALRISGDYNTAQNQYLAAANKSQKFTLISKIHLAELYMLRGQEEKFQTIVDEITPDLKVLEKDQKEEYLKGKNFVIIRTIKKGGLKKAEKMLEDLKRQVGILYEYTMQGKPLVHDIYRSLATCKSRLGRHEDALGLLKDTLQWQLVCEGKTPNVALTETLIQSVSRSSGNNGQLQKSLARLSAMSQQIESNQRRFQSSVMVGLNRSLINMAMP